jgi:hypothetical protein
MIISRWTHLRMRNVSNKSCRLYDNVEKYGRVRQAIDGNIIWRMRTACYIPKTTLRICNIYRLSTATKVAWTLRNNTLPVFSMCRTHPLATIKKNTRPIDHARSKTNIGRSYISPSAIGMAAQVQICVPVFRFYLDCTVATLLTVAVQLQRVYASLNTTLEYSPVSRSPASETRFEPGTFWIWSKTSACWTTICCKQITWTGTVQGRHIVLRLT